MHLFSFVLATLLSSASSAPALKPVAQWPLPRVNGRLLNKTDHLLIDAASERLFLSAKSLNTVFVYSLLNGSLLSAISVPAPQGLGIIQPPATSAPSAEAALLWVGSDGCGLLSAFALSDLSRVYALNFSTTATDGETDDIEVDPLSGEVLVSVGDDGPGSADPAAIATVYNLNGTLKGTLAMPGHIEGFTLVRRSNLIFANSPHATPNEVLLIARNASGILARWPLPAGVGGNTPLVWDEHAGLLYVGCREPPMLLALDPVAATVRFNTTAYPADNDDLAFDFGVGLIFASGGGAAGPAKGQINVFRADPAGKAAPVLLGTTQPAGKNSVVDVRTRRVYTTVESDGTSDAFVAVYEY